MNLIQKIKIGLLGNIINIASINQKAYTSQIVGFLGAHAIKLFSIPVAINPLAAASAYSVAKVVTFISNNIFRSIFDGELPHLDLKKACHIAAGAIGIFVGFDLYMNLLTLSTIHLIGINILSLSATVVGHKVSKDKYFTI